MTWEHAANYPEDTFGRQMYEIEKATIALGPEGSALLAQLDQTSAYYRERQAEILFGDE